MKKRVLIFASLLFWITGFNLALADESLISRNQVAHLVKDYYDTHSEWRGVFRISDIERVKLDTHDKDHITAYVRYHYVAVPGNNEGRTDEGHDQRVFKLKRQGQHWRVTHMGNYMSAHF